jgi:ABC-2 type transport system permease protein
VIKRTRRLLVKEFQQLKRDRRLVGILVIAPVIQLIVLGFAASTDVREIDLAVRDYDRTPASREYVRTLTASGYFIPFYMECPQSDDGCALVAGRAGLVLVIPKGFERSLARHEAAEVQVLIDGSDSVFAARGTSYFQLATRLYSERVAARVVTGGALRLPSVTFETRAWYNPDLRSRFYMVPAVMGILLLVTTMVVTSMALVREREQGTMEQLLVTPLTAREIIAGKLLPFVAIGFAAITLSLLIILTVFRLPPRGHVVTLYVFSGLFLVSTLGIGLLISTLVRTQQQAMMVATFFVMMPFSLLSGFAFPVTAMPAPVRAVSALMPLTYYLRAVRGIFLKGVGWPQLWDEAVFLTLIGAAVLTLAVFRFRKKLD